MITVSCLVHGTTLALPNMSAEAESDASSSSTNITEWDDYMASLSTNSTEWTDWEPQDLLENLGAEIDAVACPEGTLLDGEECVTDPTYCAPPLVFNGEKCDFDPTNCPYGYTQQNSTCHNDPDTPDYYSYLTEDMANDFLRGVNACRCRMGYHFSLRRGRCIRCRRRRVGGYRCGC